MLCPHLWIFYFSHDLIESVDMYMIDTIHELTKRRYANSCVVFMAIESGYVEIYVP